MTSFIEYEILPLVPSSAPMRPAGPKSTGQEMLESFLRSKLTFGTLEETTYPIPSSAFLNATSPTLVPQLPLRFGARSLAFELPTSLGLSAGPAFGLVPTTSFDGLVALRLQAFQDLHLKRRLLSVQESRIPPLEKPLRASLSGSKKPHVKARPATLPTTVYDDYDKSVLSEYQCLVRQQLEFFESSEEEAQWSTQGRAKNIVPGQVGIRCKWCSHMPAQCRSPGAVYFAATMNGIYQAAQNTAKNHLCKECRHIPPEIEKRLNRLRGGKRRGPGGKVYWAEGAQALGIYELEGRLRFKGSKVIGTTCNNGTD